MSNMNQIASGLYKALTESDKRKPKPYDTKAEVLRIEGNTVWVKIPGGTDETPVSRTNNANPGDQVMIRISGGRAWLLGNETAPATDNTVANYAVEQSGEAIDQANISKLAAQAANDAANEAIKTAVIAKDGADRAWEYADSAHTAAVAAGQSADAAASAALVADAKAVTAQTSANTANTYANAALDQLGVVEDVVGVLDMLQRNGQYEVTKDLTPAGGKWYFTRTGSGTTADPYEYQVIVNPTTIEYVLSTDQTVDATKIYYERTGTGTSEDPYKYEPVESIGTENPSTEGWYECTYYELVGIDQAIQNYVSSQLVVTDEGLWLKRPDSLNIQTKVLLSSTDGVVLYGPDGTVVGKYGQTAQIGDSLGFHIEIDGTEIGFYQAENKVAYINNNQLYITQSVVLQQMDLGIPVIDGGLGQWSWKVHPNGEIPSRNNLNLKWIG